MQLKMGDNNLLISVSDTASSNAVDNDRELLSGQDDIGALFSNAGPCVYRDSNIGITKCNAIIDTIPKHTHDFLLIPEVFNDFSFLVWSEF